MTPEERVSHIAHMLLELHTPTIRLSEWEENFVASVQTQFENRGTLSDKQVEVLERVYEDRTS